MKGKALLALGLAVITASFIFGFMMNHNEQRSDSYATLASPIEFSQMSEEERKIAEAIIEAYRQLEYATLTFDTSKLSNSFIDDPRFPLRKELRKEVEIAFGRVPKGAGYLTFMIAWYKNWERGAKLLEETWEKAQKEGREISREELMALEESLGFEPAFRRTEPMPPGWENWFRFYEFNIQGDVAICLYDDGGSLRRAFLVKKDGKWYIADLVILNFHA
jgi:hypothetical protein